MNYHSSSGCSYQFSSIVQGLPRTNDVKAIDVWVLSCMAFIFGTLCELAVIGYITSAKAKVGYVEWWAAYAEPQPRTRNDCAICSCSCWWYCVRCPFWTANRVDELSMVLFPTCFALFNAWYWGFYLRVIT